MNLLTKELEAKLPAIFSQECKQDEAVAYVRLFASWSDQQWFITEYCPEEKLCFGLVVRDYTEIGYFSLAELEAVSEIFGIAVIRDDSFIPKTIREIKRGLSC